MEIAVSLDVIASEVRDQCGSSPSGISSRGLKRHLQTLHLSPFAYHTQLKFAQHNSC